MRVPIKAPRVRIPFEKRRGLQGWAFLAPWLAGLSLFFLKPLATAFLYVFSKVSIRPGGILVEPVGLRNLEKVFLEDPESFRLIAESIGNMLVEVVLIGVFSLVLSILLNQSFRFRGFARALFALPVIFSSGILLTIFKQDLFATSMLQGGETTVFRSVRLEDLLFQAGLSSELVTTMTGAVNRILDLVWKSGVQILLFLAGLQSIPGTLYEVCAIEGSTAWQTFWKVTLPLVSPFILLTTVYSIIDSFTYYGNPVMQKATALFMDLSYELSTTLSVAYAGIVLVIVALIGSILSRKVFYIER